MTDLNRLRGHLADVSSERKKYYDTLMGEINQELNDNSYTRKLVPFPVQFSFETEPANITNPTEKDIVTTVHIISRLEGELHMQGSRVNSGLYTPDFNTRVKLLNALSREQVTLDKQMRLVFPEPVAKAS